MRIGILGAGVIGQLRARSVHQHPATTLAAVYDPVPAAAERAVAGTAAKPITDLAAFLDLDLDAVFVSSPVQFHEEACLAAFARGRHVLCEKPLSNSVESCRRIVDAAEKAGRILAVGFNHRLYPAIKFVKDTVDQGIIGELDHLRVFGGHDGLHNFRADWQYRSPTSGGGAMMDVGIHMTDIARYLLGEITDVYGMMSERIWKVPGSEDNAIAVFRNPEGVSASYHATWTEWKGYRFSVEAYGSLGMVRGYYAPMTNVLVTHDQPGKARKTQRRFYPEIMVREKLKSWTSTALLSFEAELRDFVAMVGGHFAGSLADGYAGLRAVEIAAAVRQSSLTREAVHLPVLGRMKG